MYSSHLQLPLSLYVKEPYVLGSYQLYSVLYYR
jgi:hypothetical protein